VSDQAGLIKNETGSFMLSLPHLQLIEYVSFIQIGAGNPQAIGELTGLCPFWQAHVSNTLNFVGVMLLVLLCCSWPFLYVVTDRR
jgi:hypothetical protein